MPTIFDVAKAITDINTIMIVKDPKVFPNEAKPSLVIIGLEDWVNENYIKMFLEEVPSVKNKQLSFNSIKIFNWNKKKTAWVKMNNFSDCESIATFFYHPIKQNIPTKNSKGEKLDIFLAFDLLEITKSNWYGVILRNLPQNCSDESIRQFCDSYVRDGVKYCIYPIMIKEVYCSIIVMNDLEDAENLCMALNGMEVSTKGRKIKVNYHPKICKIRNNVEASAFSSMFNKYGYIFDENVEQSGNVVKSGIPLPKIYAKNEQVDKNNKKEEGEIKEDNNDKKKKDEKKINKDSKLNNSIEKKSSSSSIEQSLLSLLHQSQESSKEKEEKVNESHTKASTIMDKMSHLLLQMKDLNHKQSKSNPSSPAPQENKEKESGEIASSSPNKTENANTLNTNSRTKDEDTSPNENLMQIDYDQSEINYYTYNMKDKYYYDNRKKPLDKISLDKFNEMLKIRKQKIENDLTMQKAKQQYINTKTIPVNSRYSDYYRRSNSKKHSNHYYHQDKYYDRDYHHDRGNHYHQRRERSKSRHRERDSKNYRRRSRS